MSEFHFDATVFFFFGSPISFWVWGILTDGAHFFPITLMQKFLVEHQLDGHIKNEWFL